MTLCDPSTSTVRGRNVRVAPAALEQAEDEPQHVFLRTQRRVFGIGQHKIFVHEGRKTLYVPVVECRDVCLRQSADILGHWKSPSLMSTTPDTGTISTL
jgi:hypothetical protein